MTFKRSFLLASLLIITISLSFFSGYLFKGYLNADTGDWPILSEVYEILQEKGLKAMPAKTNLEYGMIRGLLQAYNDPYTIFVEPPQHVLEGNALQGSYGGIGVRLGRDAEGNILLYPFPDGPAAKAGIQEGDHLLAVDKLQITTQTPTDTAEAALRGPVSKNVKITIGRAPSFSPTDYSILRVEIPLPSVTWHLDPGESRLGIIEVNIIASTTPQEIQNAVKDMQSRGATAFALDLRDNYGGLLTAGVDTARLFLKDGIVIQQQYRGKDLETYRVDSPGALSGLSLVVLVNKNTASAAEIIAGALKEQGRAKIIGTSTYGKDTVQLVYDLKDGSSLHVTSAHWWVPGLQPALAENGLQPDITIDQNDSGPDQDVQAAVKVFFGN
jgi:carboxyl-terminal processing protease